MRPWAVAFSLLKLTTSLSRSSPQKSDDPGLGKTITVLSLILQTHGLATATAENKEMSKESTLPSVLECRSSEDAKAIFLPYWSEKVTAEYRKPLLTRLFNSLLRDHRGPGVIPPLRVAKIRGAIDRDAYGSDFGRFERDVE
jgi:hypothetical protein